MKFGIAKESIKTCAQTGIIVDIKGTGAASKQKGLTAIALRADMDGLPMPEGGELEYKSKTKFAHMCGHDGHMATLLATAQALHHNREKIPENKFVRLLF